MMKNEWDILKTKSDIKQRLNRLFGRFDQYSEFAPKPRTSDQVLTETPPVTHINPVTGEQKEELQERQKPERDTNQRQKNISPKNDANAGIDALLRQIIFVEPLISPIRLNTELKRPLLSSNLDDAPVPKRQKLQKNGAEMKTTRTEQQPTKTKGPLNFVRLKLDKQKIHLLQQKREQHNNLKQRDILDCSTSSGTSESANTPWVPSSNLAEGPTQLDGQLVDEHAVGKLKVPAEDFDYVLENDVKPSFGLGEDELSRMLYGGLCLWGDPVSRVLEEGRLLTKETASPDTRGFVRALLTGPPSTGKSYLAAQIAKDSEFPLIKVCTPEEMVAYSETAKCAKIRMIFEDAYKSPLSCVIIDNIERMMDYSPIGPRYSNFVLQTLLVLLGKRPPRNHRLLVLATTSNEQFLSEADMLSVFNKVIRVEQLHSAKHVLAVLEHVNIFSEEEGRLIESELRSWEHSISIGIKRMLELLDFVKQSEPECRVQHLLDGIRNTGGVKDF